MRIQVAEFGTIYHTLLCLPIDERTVPSERPRILVLADLRYRLHAKEGGNVHLAAMKQAFGEFAEVLEPECRRSLAALRRLNANGRPTGLGPRLQQVFWLLVGAFEKVAAFRALKPELVYVRHELSDVPVVFWLKRLGARICLEVNAIIVQERVFAGRKPAAYRLRAAMERLAFRSADGICAVSGYLAERLAEAGAARERLFVTHNGIHAAEFPECVLGTANPQPIVGFVGNDHVWHRLPLLVSAFARLHAEHPEVRLRIVGPEPASLRAAITAAGLDEAIEVTGHLPRAEALAAIRGFDVAVMPTASPHGSALKLFEYMGLGRAIVAAATPAASEVLTSGENALLFPVDDEDGLVGALKTALADGALRERLGRSAFDTVHAGYTWRGNALAVLGRTAPELLPRAVPAGA